jgi:hypothetical protein
MGMFGPVQDLTSSSRDQKNFFVGCLKCAVVLVLCFVCHSSDSS